MNRLDDIGVPLFFGWLFLLAVLFVNLVGCVTFKPEQRTCWKGEWGEMVEVPCRTVPPKKAPQ